MTIDTKTQVTNVLCALLSNPEHYKAQSAKVTHNMVTRDEAIKKDIDSAMRIVKLLNEADYV
jgi:hypothetical protein